MKNSLNLFPKKVDNLAGRNNGVSRVLLTGILSISTLTGVAIDWVIKPHTQQRERVGKSYDFYRKISKAELTDTLGKAGLSIDRINEANQENASSPIEAYNSREYDQVVKDLTRCKTALYVKVVVDKDRSEEVKGLCVVFLEVMQRMPSEYWRLFIGSTGEGNLFDIFEELEPNELDKIRLMCSCSIDDAIKNTKLALNQAKNNGGTRYIEDIGIRLRLIQEQEERLRERGVLETPVRLASESE